MKKSRLSHNSTLRHSTPLRRTKGLRRTRLAKMSKSKQAWNKLYEQAKRVSGSRVRSAFSGLLMHRSMAEPHHCMGRRGVYLLCWVWLSRDEHKQIHDHGQQSRKLHWLMKPYDGLPYDPNEPRPFPASAESHWPEEFKRINNQAS